MIASLLSSRLLLTAVLALQQPPPTSTPAPGDGDPAAESRLLSGTRQLTFEGLRAGEGYFSRDGTKLIFQSERDPENPFYQIYLMDLELGDVTRVSPGIGKTTCAWIHPDGKRVLFASTHADPESLAHQKAELELRAQGQQRRYAWDYDPWFDIYETDPARGALTNLTNTRGYDAEGDWAPDGSRIVFASNRRAYAGPLSPEDRKRLETDASYFVDIYVMDADGSNVRQLTDAPGYDGGPFFSADGRTICWRRFSEDGATAEIYTMKADGSDPRRLTSMGAMSWAPFFHPSGEYLIFTTNKHGFDNFELYLVDADGKHEPVRVTYTPGFDGLPAFAPDGRRLAWTSNRTPDKRSQIFLADWNHTEARRLLELSPSRVQGARIERPSPSGNAVGGAAQGGASRTTPEISADDVRLHVARLASDEFEGRLTGTEGEKLATAYVAEQFERLGLRPAGADGSYFQEFEFTAGVSLGPDNNLRLQFDPPVTSAPAAQIGTDWQPLAFSGTGTFEPAAVVFAGYGIVAPQDGDADEYDSFVHLDVKDKWVMVLRFMPEGISAERRQHLARHASLRYKAMTLRDKGARGMIVVSGPTSRAREQLVKLAYDASLSGTGIPAISMTDALADALLAPGGKSLAALQTALDGGEPQMGMTLAGVTLGATIDVQKIKRTGRNVLARLPAAPAAEGHVPLPAIVLGAHVDHLGHGEVSGSLAREDEQGQIHHGADDNASGVAGLLEIAEFLADAQGGGRFTPIRDLLFAAWSGEELGLLGSAHFVEQVAQASGHSTDLRKAFAAYLNMDMIGRLDKALILQGVGSSTMWPGIIEQRNAPIGLPITTQTDSYLPTDATSFYLKGVPILAAFTGSHAEYHTPRDKPETLNYDGAAKVARLIGLTARGLALSGEALPYVAQAKPAEREARAGLRAYLGTIPDYAAGDVPGLKLSGVSKGGPAESAGVKGGDVVVELAGRKIENIYDYTYAMDALKIGQEVEIVVLRNGARLTLKVTPTSRE